MAFSFIIFLPNYNSGKRQTENDGFDDYNRMEFSFLNPIFGVMETNDLFQNIL